MDDIRIPCIVWFHGDPPPDLSGFANPVRIPFALRRPATRSDDSATPTDDLLNDGWLTTNDPGNASLLQLAASTTNPGYTARMLGYDRNTFGNMIYEFKPFYGLVPSDNVVFRDNGDVLFQSGYIGNIHDFAP